MLGHRHRRGKRKVRRCAGSGDPAYNAARGLPDSDASRGPWHIPAARCGPGDLTGRVWAGRTLLSEATSRDIGIDISPPGDGDDGDSDG